MIDKFRPIVEDEVLLTLYEGQLDPYPRPFKLFLEALKARLGLLTAGIDIGIGANDIEPVPITYYPVSDARASRLFKDYQKHWRVYPRKLGVKAGDVYTLDQIISAKEFAHNAYARSVMTPLGVKNELVAAVSGPDEVVCLLRLGVGAGVSFTDHHFAFIKQLRRHLETALQMHMLIRRPASIINMLTTMADTLEIGFFILSGQRKTLQCNEVARQIARRGNNFSLIDGKVFCMRNETYNKLLSDFFESALLWRYRDFQRSMAGNPSARAISDEIPSALFRIDGADGNHVDFLAQPVRTFVPYRNETSPHLIVYIVDSSRHIAASEKLVMQLHGLTRTEARLAMLLANGCSIMDAATSLGLTEGSARTYSKRIYAKTGVKRQAELVQRLHQSVVSLAKV
jgi:DNA-binding CsgD family transcriptional regulator